MASIADLWGGTQGSYSPGASFLSSQPGFEFSALKPQYRLDYTAPYLQEDTAIADSRALRNWGQRQLPQMVNQGAAMGQWGSGGLTQRADWAKQDVGDTLGDTQRMLARNMADLARQRTLSIIGGGASVF